MKIKRIDVILTWEDDNQNNVTDYLPAQTFADLECFADYWQAEYSEDHEETE